MLNASMYYTTYAPGISAALTRCIWCIWIGGSLHLCWCICIGVLRILQVRCVVVDVWSISLSFICGTSMRLTVYISFKALPSLFDIRLLAQAQRLCLLSHTCFHEWTHTHTRVQNIPKYAAVHFWPLVFGAVQNGAKLWQMKTPWFNGLGTPRVFG